MESKTESRVQSVKKNIFIAVLYQIVSAIVGLVLPRYILRTFGSDVNGVMQSIGQFLGYTMLLECGIVGMVLASFYKPIALHDEKAVSDIFNSTKKFFNKVSVVFIGLVVIIAVSAKFIINTGYDAYYVGGLVIVLGISYYFNYYFGITHQLLIKADQKIYIVQTIQIITIILNAIVCIICIKAGAGVHMVKLISAFVFLLNPVLYRLYVKKHYKISKNIFDSSRQLPRKRDGVIHHIAYFIHRNTDVVILSIFCGAKVVSVYSVYYAVILGIENFLNAVSSGIAGTVGNIIAKSEEKMLTEVFEIYEQLNTLITTFFCSVAAILIVPFVSIYTKGVTDVDYIRPVFAYLLIAAQWFYCVRIPYENVVNSAGHYRQTKPGAYMEASLNLVISLLAVHRFGLAGVAFGTMTAMIVRTVYIAWYLSKNILNRKFTEFIKSAGLNLIASIVAVTVISLCFKVSSDSFIYWAIDAVIISIVIFAALAILNFIVHKKLYISLLKELKSRRNRND